jgi:hypothetical protein
VANPILVPDPGVSHGSNLDAAAHEIPAGQGRFVQDALLDKPGIVRQRGPITNLSSDFPSLPTNVRIIGMTALADPNGTNSFRLLLLVADKNTFAVKAYIYGRQAVPVTPAWNARAFFDMIRVRSNTGRLLDNPYLYFMDRRTAAQSFGALLTTLTLSGLQILNADNDPFFQSSLSMDGGATIGIGMAFGADASRGSHRAMFHWRGAAKADYAMGGTTTIAATQNSQAVVGVNTTFTTLVEPGMFLVDSTGRRLGTVKSVQDNTHLTLEQNIQNPTFAARNTDKFTSLHRPYTNPNLGISAGTIVASIASPIINGGGTKFVDQGVAVNDLVFRANDYAFVGTVTSVQSNEQLTLTGNANIALANEDYLITHAAPWSAGSEPVFSAYFNGMQLLANADNNRAGFNERSRIFVTDAKNLEPIDLTKTGSFYDLPSTKPHTDIRGIYATESAAVVFLAEATYGLFGNTPTNLVPKVIASDGLLSPMAVQSWQGGLVWAGFQSIYYFDGSTVHDLLAGKVQATHARAVAGIDYTKYRAWSMLANNHYICFLQSINVGNFTHFQGRQNITTPGGITFDPSTIIYAINLETGAIGFWTNVSVRGYSSPPGALVSRRDSYFVTESTLTGGPIISSANALFDRTGSAGFVQDAFLTNPAVYDFAPHFYVAGRLNSFGDPELLKRAVMVLAQYALYGGNTASKLGVDIVTDIGEITKAISPKDRTSADVSNPIVWKNKRSRFGKKANLIGVRFYTMADGQPTSAYIGPWSLGFKPMRPGRT